MLFSLGIVLPITPGSSAYAPLECLTSQIEIFLSLGRMVLSMKAFRTIQNRRAHNTSPCLSPLKKVHFLWNLTLLHLLPL